MLKKTLISIAILIFATLNTSAQKEKMQSVLVYNFVAKFVEWPASYKSGDFVIGVLGNSSIIEEFNTIAAAKTVGSQKIVVKKFNSAGDITMCHVLFVTDSKMGELETSLGKVGTTLVITDSDGGAKKGAAINFVIVDNKQKFELKTSNATKKGLKVSPELENIAILVN